MSQVRTQSASVSITFESQNSLQGGGDPCRGDGLRRLPIRILPEYNVRPQMGRLIGGRCHQHPHYPRQPQPGHGVIRPICPTPVTSGNNRPSLTGLMSAVDTFDESGFKDARDMTKNLLSGLYENPQKFHDQLESIQRNFERDDATASFLRALLESGPGGAALLKSIPLKDKQTMMEYLGTGNAWSANKKGVYLALARELGLDQKIINNQPVTVNGVNLATGFNDNDTMDFVRRYQGVLS